MISFGRIAALFVLIANVGFAASRVECDSVPSRFVPPAVHYCALLPDNLPPSSDTLTKAGKTLHVLYFLHGLGQDSQSLLNEGLWNLVDNLEQKKKLGEFVIITPDAGRSFYINSKDGRTKYEDFFLREFMPAMEKRYHLAHTREGRVISGISMGGYGALRFAFAHPELFA